MCISNEPKTITVSVFLKQTVTLIVKEISGRNELI